MDTRRASPRQRGGHCPRVPGPIIRIAVVDNQHVQRGDLLFEIDPADYHAAVEQVEAQVLAAKAALTQRKQELGRQAELFQKKVNPLQEYQDAQDNYDSAQANLAAAKANLQSCESVRPPRWQFCTARG